MTKQLREGRAYFGSEFETTTLHSREFAAEDCETPGCSASSVKKQRAGSNVASSSFSFLFSSGPQPIKQCHPYLKNLPNSFNLVQITPHRQARRRVSSMVTDNLKVTVNTKHHEASPINKTGSVFWDRFFIQTMLTPNYNCMVWMSTNHSWLFDIEMESTWQKEHRFGINQIKTKSQHILLGRTKSRRQFIWFYMTRAPLTRAFCGL